MPDWNAKVAAHCKLDLHARDDRELVQELANHLEDLFEQFLGEGLPESEAYRRTLKAADLDGISRNLRHATGKEPTMNRRTKTLWLPGLASLAAASVSLMLLQQIVWLQPRIWWKDGGALVIHGSWFLLLPLCGAVGTYLSKRAGGTRAISIAAGLFPAIVMLAVFSIFLPIAILLERNAYVIHHPLYFSLALLNWIVVPAVALLIGSLAVRRTFHGAKQVIQSSF